MEKSLSITTVATPKTPTTTVALNSPQPVVKLVKLSTPTTITTSCDITNNQEQIVEKAKQVITMTNSFNTIFLQYRRQNLYVLLNVSPCKLVSTGYNFLQVFDKNESIII